ncbi:CU044_5270 family protein [Streptomyces hirsutus]|uniref:CU044_5270 family protein n=1 Tax=Streptomyces hirsutus TaxID=35620 RepID=UPI0033B35C3D
MRDIDQALQRLNPVQDGASADTEKLKNILAMPRPVVSAARPRSLRRWSVATMAVATAATVVYTVVDPFGTSAQPALAVTPQPLAYHSGSPSAAQVLRDIASRVEELPDDRPTAWKTEHFVWNAWFLSTRVDGTNVTSAVIPEHRETWQKRDGSASWKIRTLPPVFQDESQREVWEKAGSIGAESVVSQDSSGPTSGQTATEPPTTEAGMRNWLANGRDVITPGLLYEVVSERFQEHVFSPAQRAAVLRVLAETEGVRYEGTVQDRAGRTGQAFSITDASGGLPTKRALIFDPQTGELLADEEQILGDTGKLQVAPNSVIGYVTFLTSERQP